ncbi:hypothetical protein E4Z66_02810 [Aliishimia ponticola]|uniref:Uncharacterized protein n=1 Tax=Aliishimia ponticola TaxID=2499833 RepID=A0A4S4NFX1_9RHOB|nr:hypothetical protein [Aliishimia ponticola]THH38516.1 hypothetical protein E4Z66_02810 [Aliishimia ponticola]
MKHAKFRLLLDEISDCYVEQDFGKFCRNVQLPLDLITRTGLVSLRSEDELEQNFSTYIDLMAASQLSQIVRTEVGLEQCDEENWIGTYDTDLLRKGTRISPRYRSSMLMRWESGKFRASSILNARGHSDWMRMADRYCGADREVA